MFLYKHKVHRQKKENIWREYLFLCRKNFCKELIRLQMDKTDHVVNLSERHYELTFTNKKFENQQPLQETQKSWNHY